MTHKYLLCCDMDRTLIPNGIQTEEHDARIRFSELVKHQDIVLAYVTGRDLSLVQAAIDEWQLPTPDFVVADVGANIYQVIDGRFHAVDTWQQKLKKDWKGLSSNDIKENLEDLQHLSLQEQSAQKDNKLSYCVEPSHLADNDLAYINNRLSALDIEYTIVESIDETKDQALIDILPSSASKKLAIEFLVSTQGFSNEKVFFAGDSGNDIDALTSHFNATVVANAAPDVTEKVKYIIQQSNNVKHTYFAGKQSNGNYAAGILEGFLHFYPEFKKFH